MDPFTLIAAGIAAIGSIIGIISTNRSNQKLSEQNNDLQRQLVATANQQNIEQWQRENAYNTPALQMQRLREAGLNPSLTMTNGSLMNEAAASPAMQAASVRASQNVSPQMIDPLTAAQIANLDADTQQKKGLTKSTEIENTLGSMNLNAFQRAYDEGLVDDAIQAGFAKDILDSRMSRYSFMQSAWDFAVYTGMSLKDSATLGRDGSGKSELSVIPDFDFNLVVNQSIKESFKLHSSLFNSNMEAQTEANKAAKKLAELQQQENDKDFDIWSYLNKEADDGALWAKVARVGLWLFKQQFNTPNFNLSIKGADKSMHNAFTTNNKTTFNFGNKKK